MGSSGGESERGDSPAGESTGCLIVSLIIAAPIYIALGAAIVLATGSLTLYIIEGLFGTRLGIPANDQATTYLMIALLPFVLAGILLSIAYIAEHAVHSMRGTFGERKLMGRTIGSITRDVGVALGLVAGILVGTLIIALGVGMVIIGFQGGQLIGTVLYVVCGCGVVLWGGGLIWTILEPLVHKD